MRPAIRALRAQGIHVDVRQDTHHGASQESNDYSVAWIGTDVPSADAIKILTIARHEMPWLRYVFLHDNPEFAPLIHLSAHKDWIQTRHLQVLGDADFAALKTANHTDESFRKALRSLERAPDAANEPTESPDRAGTLLANALLAIERRDITTLAQLDLMQLTGKQRNDLLTTASGDGDLELVDHLLRRAVDPNAEDSEGGRALAAAVAAGRTPAVERLLAAGAIPDARDASGATALVVAASAPSGYSLVKVILSHGADPNLVTSEGLPPLLASVLASQDDTAELLLASGADPSQADGRGATPLIVAVLQDNERIARALIGAGADPFEVNRLGHSAALVALTKEASAFVDALQPATMSNAQYHEAVAKIRQGIELVVAVEAGDEKLVHKLLAAGVSPDLRHPAGTPLLLLAAYSGNAGIVSALVEAKADLNARDAEGVAQRL